jgi:hypothetical protein
MNQSRTVFHSCHLEAQGLIYLDKDNYKGKSENSEKLQKL